MGYEPLFWIIFVLTLGAIVFSRRDIERWRRMLGWNIILIGLCALSGALAFFPGNQGFILGIAGLLPASVASMRFTRNGLQNRAWPRKTFQVVLEHPRLAPGEELLQEQDRIDEENEYRNLGSRWLWAFLPAFGMGTTAITFQSWPMGVMAAGVAALASWTVQPALVRRSTMAGNTTG
jgi:hypothetical protein